MPKNIRGNFAIKHIVETLENTANIAEASRTLGVSAQLLGYWINNEGIKYDNSEYLNSLRNRRNALRVAHPAKILTLDIETTPNLAWVWGIWNQNVALNQLEDEWSILCWAAKWLDSNDVIFDASWLSNEETMIKHIWLLLDEADVIVGHNVDRFDKRKINARFLKYGLTPPSPYKVVDTLSVVKKNFALTSNKLAYVAKFLGVSEKLEQGIDMKLWITCMEGCPKARKTMRDYNKQDVITTEEVYKVLLPWISNHPNANAYTDAENPLCPKCGSANLELVDKPYTAVILSYEMYRCADCNGYCRARAQQHTTKEKKQSIKVNVSGS